MEVEATVNLKCSTWLAARVVDHPDLQNRILPREVSVFAHTSPTYFLRDGRKVREEASIAYLQKYVEGFLHWLGTNPPFVNEIDQQNARRDAEESLRFYRSLSETCSDRPICLPAACQAGSFSSRLTSVLIILVTRCLVR